MQRMPCIAVRTPQGRPLKKYLNFNLKLVIGAALLTLLAVALGGCDSEPSPSVAPAPIAAVSSATPSSIASPEPTATAAIVAVIPTVTSSPTTTTIPEPTASPVPIESPTPTGTAVQAELIATASPQATATSPPATRLPTVAPKITATPTPVAATPTATPEPVATVAPEPEPDTSLAFDTSVTRGTLSNGLSYYVKRNRVPSNRAQLSLVLKAGSVLEEEDQRGLAHFVEHMAFNGTERFAKQQIVDYLESIGSSFGGDLNAQTGYDHTMYWLEIPTDDPEIIETAFQILSDWAFAVTFAPEEVNLERGVILEEWRGRQGFGTRLQDSLFPLLYGSSRYAERHPIGLPAVVESADVEDLRALYERWYRPDLMAVIAVGDFDTSLIEAKVRHHFAPSPDGEALYERAAVAPPTDRPGFDIPEHDEPRVAVFSDPEAPGTQLILARKVSPDSGKDVAAFRRGVAERLAFMMMNARLSERRQVADPPYLWAGGERGSLVESLDIVNFSAWLETDGVERGFAALLEELQRVRQYGFTDTELAREKINLLSSVESVYRQREQLQSGDLAQTYIDHFLSETPVPGIETERELYQAILPQVTLDEVSELTASWSELANTVLLVMRPEGTESGTDDELVAVIQAQLEAADTLEVDPYLDDFDDVPLLATLPAPGTITSEERIEYIDALKWTLSNGITVVAKQTGFRNDELAFSAFSPGGHSLVADTDHVSALYAARIAAGSGVGLHDNVTLGKLLTGKTVSVSPYIDELFEGFRGGASPEDLETLFQLITLYATSARFDPAYFSRFETSMRSIAETSQSQPDTVLFDAVNSALSQNHFRVRPLTDELLEELSLERVEAVYADRFADLGDATFVFVGAFDWEELRSLVAEYLASLPTEGRAEQWRDLGIDPPKELQDHVVRAGIEPRSTTVVVYAGELERSIQEILALEAAGEVLAIRLRERVREELGGTYSIGVNTRAGFLPDPEYKVYVLFDSDPSRAEELFAEVQEELEWLRAGGEQKYLDTVRELLRTPRQEQLQSNGFWLRQIQSSIQRDLPFDVIVNFDERLEELTLEQVAAAARRYLDSDRYVRIVLLPEDG